MRVVPALLSHICWRPVLVLILIKFLDGVLLLPALHGLFSVSPKYSQHVADSLRCPHRHILEHDLSMPSSCTPCDLGYGERTLQMGLNPERH